MEDTAGDRADRAKREQLDTKDRDARCSADFWAEPGLCDGSVPLNKGLCLVAILLLAGGLWAAIWGVVALLASRNLD
jgi:hypothetical protein